MSGLSSRGILIFFSFEGRLIARLSFFSDGKMDKQNDVCIIEEEWVGRFFFFSFLRDQLWPI